MISYTDKSMWQVQADVIVNPINCVGTMGLGIAKIMRDSIPEMFAFYKDCCKRGEIKPGTVMTVRAGRAVIANIPTKRHYRDPSRLDDVRMGLETLAKACRFSQDINELWPNVRIAMPKIGCGSGGLDWDGLVEPLVDEILHDFDVSVCLGRLEVIPPPKYIRCSVIQHDMRYTS